MRRALWRSWSLVVIFGISIPVAFVAVEVAPYLWIAVLPVQLWSRRADTRPASR